MRVNFDIDDKLLKIFDENAKFHYMTRAELIRQLIRNNVSNVTAAVAQVEASEGRVIDSIQEAADISLKSNVKELKELPFSVRKQRMGII